MRKTKRFIAVALSVLLSAVLLPWTSLSIAAADAASLHFFCDEGEAYLNFCDADAQGELVIPATFDGCSVTGISSDAFRGCDQLSSVSIPAGIEYLPEGLFSECTALCAITVAQDNTAYCSVDGVLYTKSEDTLICYPSAKVGAFSVPEGVVSIAENAFMNQAELSAISFPDTLKNIGSYAFCDCTALEAVALPDGIAQIGGSAFMGCSLLSTVSGLNGVTELGEDVFLNTEWYDAQPDGIIYAGSAACGYKGTIPESGEIVVREGTTCLCDSLFCSSWDFDSSGLNSISLPQSLVSIGASAFEGCTGLTRLTIPEFVTHIGANAFYDTGIETLYFNAKDCQCMGEYEDDMSVFWVRSAFGYDGYNTENTTLKHVNFGSNVKTVPAYAFAACKALETPVFPEGLLEIGDGAFWGCTAISAIQLPDSLTALGDAFYNTAWYNSQPEGEVYLGNFFFRYKGDLSTPTEITLRSGTKGVAGRAFSSQNNLTGIHFPDTVTSIGSWAFYETGLTALTLPDAVTSVGTFAFYECAGIKEIKAPAGLTQVGRAAFADYTILRCADLATALRYAEIPDLYCWYDVNGTLYDENGVLVTAASPVLTDRNGLFFEVQGNTLTLTEIKGSGDIVIPSALSGKTVTAITAQLNLNSGAIRSVTIPATVTDIDEYSLGYFYDFCDLTIRGYTGSQAQRFAVSNIIAFERLDSPAYIVPLWMKISDKIASGAFAGDTASEIIEKLANESDTLRVFDASGRELEDMNARVCTGYTVKLYNISGDVLDSVSIAVKGDLNGDGFVDAFDAAVAELSVNHETFLSGAAFRAADTNEDEEIALADFSDLVNLSMAGEAAG